MQVQRMALFFVIGMLTAAPALAIKIDRRPSPNIDEPPLMNASMKVEPLLASGGGGAAAEDHLRPGSLGAVQVSEQVEKLEKEITTNPRLEEVLAADGKPGFCGCRKDDTYNHIFKATPVSLAAAKTECKNMEACTGIVWANKAAWDMIVKSNVPNMITGRCGFGTTLKAWRFNSYTNIYRCFKKVVPVALTDHDFVSLTDKATGKELGWGGARGKLGADSNEPKAREWIMKKCFTGDNRHLYVASKWTSKNENQGTKQPLKYCDVIAWYNRKEGKVLDCGSGRCAGQAYPNPWMAWGSPKKILGKQCGTPVMDGDEVYYSRMESSGFQPNTELYVHCNSERCHSTGGSAGLQGQKTIFTIKKKAR